MPVPADVVWDADPHTLAKHRILDLYLAAWLPTLLHGGFLGVTYTEGFAGPGVYRGGEPGSPVMALRTILGQRALLTGGRVVDMVLVEEDSRRLAELQRQMAAALDECSLVPDSLRIEYVGGDQAEVLLPALERVGAMRRPVFALLDSFGGPDVPLEVARRIGRAPASEVLVTFGTSFLVRFCEVEGRQTDGDRVFGSREWRRVTGLDPSEKKPFLVAAYRRSLQRAGFTHVVSFEMLDEHGHDLHLVFGTRHPAGVEKMKTAIWKIDPVNGVRFRDPRDPSQDVLDFILNPDLSSLTRSVLAELGHGPRTLAQLKDYALLETVYKRAHARTVVRDLLSRRVIEREPARGHLVDASLIRLIGSAPVDKGMAPETLF